MAEDIAAICSALLLAPSQAQLRALVLYIHLLQRWNATYNLTSVRDPAGMLSHHLADCLALIPALQRHRAHGQLLDVGSGGGLPGVVIATMMPWVSVTCVDAVAKKTAFVRHVAATLQLPNLLARHGRVEALPGGAFDVITARAFASLPDLVTWSRRQLAPAGVWLAMKGKVPHDEMATLPVWADVFHVEQLVVPGLDAQRCLVWLRQAAVDTQR